jgi:hypothetical protein
MPTSGKNLLGCLLLFVLILHGCAAGGVSLIKEIANDGRFTAYNDGTVIDTRTGLLWAARDNGSNINWASAKSYCENYRGGGYTDWRMPTQDELVRLYDNTKTYVYLGLGIRKTRFRRRQLQFLRWTTGLD